MQNRERETFPRRDIEEGAVEPRVHQLLVQASHDALSRIKSLTPEVTGRIQTALERRFLPYAIENESIAKQLESPEYRKFVKEIDAFLDAKVGFGACPDGRVSPFSLADPKVASIHRRLQGLPETRQSTTEEHVWVLDDPDLAASIKTDMQEREEEGKSNELVEFVGPHIHSSHPAHGCGACIGKLAAKGRTPELGMRYGGIAEYFEELGDGFNAFDNVVKIAGGKGTTFDLTHDAYSQGFIVGLRNEYKNFNKNLSLRQNLELLAARKKILMTEKFDEIFTQNIIDESTKMGVEGYIDVSDYEQFGKNAMLIGRIAKKITIQEEAKGYRWIPESIKDGKSQTAVRVLAYHAIRNTVYRVLGDIQPGQHMLQEHPEQLIRVGPIGSDYNIRNIAFVQSTPRGRLQSGDIEGVDKLYNLSYGILRKLGADLQREGRIILITGIYDSTHHASRKSARAELNEVESVVLNNAAWIRKKFAESIQTGEAIVIGCLFDPLTRRLTHVLSSRENGSSQVPQDINQE